MSRCYVCGNEMMTGGCSYNCHANRVGHGYAAPRPAQQTNGDETQRRLDDLERRVRLLESKHNLVGH